MKSVLFSALFLLSASAFADDLLLEAEKLFDAGAYFDAEKLLIEYINEHENETSRELIKARSMLEYITLRNPECIESTLKKYQGLSEKKMQNYDSLLSEVSQGIMSARIWKREGHAEWIALSQYLLSLLDHAETKLSEKHVLKLVFYRAELYSLTGETEKCRKLLEEAISHYYPAKEMLEKMSPDEKFTASNLYILLGDIYSAMAVKADIREIQIKYYSLAGTTWLKAYSVLREGTSLYSETVRKLQNCKEILSLLGHNLILPSEIIKNKQNLLYPLIWKMLQEKRYVAAEKVIDPELEKKDLDDAHRSELAGLKLISIGGQKRYPECVSFLQKNRRLVPVTSNFLYEYLKLSDLIRVSSGNENALIYNSVLSTMPYHKRDMNNILFQCANLSLNCGKLKEAKKYFEDAAAFSEDSSIQQQALSQAAQCADKLKDYEEAFRLSEKAIEISVPEKILDSIRILHLQSAIKLEKYDLAMQDAKILLTECSLDKMYRNNVLLLAAITEKKQGNLHLTDQYFTTYLSENPDAANYFSVLSELKGIRLSSEDIIKLTAMCEMVLNSHADAEETYLLILEIGDILRKRNKIEESLKIYEMLLRIKKRLSESQLIFLSDLFQKNDFKSKEQDAYSIARQILEKNLPEFSDSPPIKEIYFRSALLCFYLDDYDKAVYYLRKLLYENKIYRAEDVLNLYGTILDKQGLWIESAKVWRRLMLTAKKTNRLIIIEKLAFAEMQAGAYEKAVATAFLAFPPDKQKPENEYERRILVRCLDVLLKSAEKANLTDDYNEGKKIKSQLERK